MITFFDCFSGIGGFRLGLLRAGFKCAGYCEQNAQARQFYQTYFKPDGEYESNDITTIDLGKVPAFNLLTFGAPCQPFSYAGNREGMADTRGGSLWEALFQLLAAKLPRAFIMEEVPGILNCNKGRDFAWILAQVSARGYDCEWNVLDFRSHNIPQGRKRLFMVGHLRGASRSEIFPLGKEEIELYKPPQKKGRGGQGGSGTNLASRTGEKPIVMTCGVNYAPTL